jgi:hypothetical protein
LAIALSFFCHSAAICCSMGAAHLQGKRCNDKEFV